MKNRIYVISGFSRFNIDQFSRLKVILGLSMPLDSLRFCAQYYASAGRDPYSDELQMLDRLSGILEASPLGVTLPEVTAAPGDSALATYRDLAEKHRVLSPRQTRPMTLPEVAGVANSYLQRSGKAVPDRFLSVTETISGKDLSVQAHSVLTADGRQRLRFFDPVVSSKESGRTLLALLLPKEGQTPLSFRRTAEAFLASGSVGSYLAGAMTVPAEGVLSLLLEQVSGAWIDLSALRLLDLPVNLTVLNDHYAGDLLLQIPEAAIGKLREDAMAAGLEVSVFAAVTHNDCFTFSRSRKETFSLRSDFLSRLFHYKDQCASLPEEGSEFPDDVRFRPLSIGQNCAYLRSDTAASSDAVSCAGKIVSAAAAAPAHSFFRSSVLASLFPVISLALCGAAPEDQLLSVRFGIPNRLTEKEAAGAALSVILGLYRVQAEFSVYASSIRFSVSGEGVATPSVSVFSVATGSVVPNRLCRVGSKVYAVNIPLSQDGLPDFAALRKILRICADASRNSSVFSARILCGEALTDGLRKMQGENRCMLSDPSIAGEGVLPFAILLESDAELPFRLVGSVAAAPSVQAVTETFAPTASLIWSEKTEVVLLADPEDGDASVLASALSRAGASVQVFHAGADVLAFSRALLGSHLLFLCRGAVLPQSVPEVHFALEVMQKAGGRVIAFGQNETIPEGAIHRSEALSSEDLALLCKKEAFR